MNGEIVRLRQCLSNMSGQGGDQVCALDDRSEPKKTRQLQNDLTFNAFTSERLLKQLSASARRYGNVPLIAKLFDSEARPNPRVMTIGETHPVLIVQLLLIDSASEPGHITNRKIGFARLEGSFRIAVDTCGFQSDTGRLRADMGQQPRQQCDVTRVGHADPKPPLRCRRVERNLPRRETAQ